MATDATEGATSRGTEPTDELLAVLGSAVTVAARAGRVDVVAELAAIVGRLAGEGRVEKLEARGVPVLGAPKAKR